MSSARAQRTWGPGAIGWYGMHACLYISADASVLSARSTHARLALSVCVWLLNYQVSAGDLLKRSQYTIHRASVQGYNIILAARQSAPASSEARYLVKREEKDRATNRLWRISILTATMPVSLEEGYIMVIWSYIHAQLHLGKNIYSAFVCNMCGARFVVLCCVAACLF